MLPVVAQATVVPAPSALPPLPAVDELTSAELESQECCHESPDATATIANSPRLAVLDTQNDETGTTPIPAAECNDHSATELVAGTVLPPYELKQTAEAVTVVVEVPAVNAAQVNLEFFPTAFGPIITHMAVLEFPGHALALKYGFWLKGAVGAFEVAMVLFRIPFNQFAYLSPLAGLTPSL